VTLRGEQHREDATGDGVVVHEQDFQGNSSTVTGGSTEQS
jgi:hypothetical protein